jgi:hypothetical protein
MIWHEWLIIACPVLIFTTTGKHRYLAIVLSLHLAVFAIFAQILSYYDLLLDPSIFIMQATWTLMCQQLLWRRPSKYTPYAFVALIITWFYSSCTYFEYYMSNCVDGFCDYATPYRDACEPIFILLSLYEIFLILRGGHVGKYIGNMCRASINFRRNVHYSRNNSVDLSIPGIIETNKLNEPE